MLFWDGFHVFCRTMCSKTSGISEYLLLMMTMMMRTLQVRPEKTSHQSITGTVLNALCFKIMLWSAEALNKNLTQDFQYCIICKGKWILFSSRHYLMSLSRKLYFPKSLSFGAIRWSFVALASFIKRNSLRSLHSFSSCSPWASLHKSSSVHVPLRNLKQEVAY